MVPAVCADQAIKGDLEANEGDTRVTTADTTAPVLDLSDITVRFGGIAALRGVSLHAADSHVIGIIGPNGAGKTTLFDVISGVRTPDQGRVAIGGNDVTRTSATARARLGLRRTFQRVQPFGLSSCFTNSSAFILSIRTISRGFLSAGYTR